MKLKVCGMRSPENIQNLAELMPDYMGFIFWEPSKRFVSNTTPKLDLKVKKVGVKFLAYRCKLNDKEIRIEKKIDIIDE